MRGAFQKEALFPVSSLWAPSHPQTLPANEWACGGDALPQDWDRDASFSVTHPSCPAQPISCLQDESLADKINPLWNSFSETLGVSLKFRNHCLSKWSKATKRKKDLRVLSSYLLSARVAPQPKEEKRKKVYLLTMLEAATEIPQQEQ